MLTGVLKVFVEWLVGRLVFLTFFDQILEHTDIIDYVFVIYKRYVCLLERTNLFHYFTQLILETE